MFVISVLLLLVDINIMFVFFFLSLSLSDCNSPSKPKSPAVKKIGVGHISKVMSEVYGSSVQAQRSDEIPLQQKLAVCTLLLIIKNSKFKEVPLGKVITCIPEMG